MILERWSSFAHNKINEIGATFTSGAMAAGSIDDSWTLSDWSTVLGMVYVSTMLIPRLFGFGKWLYKKWEKYNDENARADKQ